MKPLIAVAVLDLGKEDLWYFNPRALLPTLVVKRRTAAITGLWVVW